MGSVREDKETAHAWELPRVTKRHRFLSRASLGTGHNIALMRPGLGKYFFVTVCIQQRLPVLIEV